jgi:antitoxin (DNA-binding transcriptional repressor) of toxin-antitoxin stability system
MSETVGIEQARATLGDIANRAHLQGTSTYLTRNGKPIAAVVPVDRAERQPGIDGTARWDKDSRTLTITPLWSAPQRVIQADNIEAAKYRRLDPSHVLALAGWRVPPGSPSLYQSPDQVNVIHYPAPPDQAGQMAAWVAEYGQRAAMVRGVGDRIRFLVVTDQERIVLEAADPNGTLFQRASTALAAWHATGESDTESGCPLAQLIAGIGL